MLYWEIKMKLLLTTILIWAFCTNACAIAPADYAQRFKVDMNDKIPPIEELRKKFAPKPKFDRKFDYYWNIGDKFNQDFSQTIQTYGTREKRLKGQNEDLLINSIAALPKETYPYIGPYMHTIPGMPEKLLNMPGIKETKNKFPERVAKAVADIENLEYISPAFYFLLMPEVWGEENNLDRILSETKIIQPSNKHNYQTINDVSKVIKPEDYAFGANPEAAVETKLRTITPNASSPLTSKDIQAVAASFYEIGEFSKNIYILSEVIEAGAFLDAWENSEDKGTILPNLKDLVNPCQRLIQKLKMQGLEKEFSLLIAQQGFSQEEWGYTCDKTIKAYRVLNMTSNETLAVMLYRRNINKNALLSYSKDIAPSIAMTMQSMVEMYQAPIDDVIEVKKNSQTLKKAFEHLGYRIVSQPIYIK